MAHRIPQAVRNAPGGLCLLLDRILRVECEVELEDVHARLAEETELPSRGVGLDEAPDIRFRRYRARAPRAAPGSRPPPARGADRIRRPTS